MLAAAEEARQVIIITPYIKNEAITQLLASINADTLITCVTRWSINDLQSGSSDVGCASFVTAAGGDFRLHPLLHAKYYRFDSTILIGSANLTNAGMGISGESNIEILCEAPATFGASKFEEAILAESITLNSNDIKAWELAISIMDKEPSVRGLAPVHWNPQTRDPEDVWMAYRGQKSEITSSEQKTLAMEDLRQLALPPDLTRTQFEAMLRVHLLSCAQAYDVRQVAAMGDARASAVLERRWGVARGAAQRHRETIRNWLNAFLEGG